MPNSLIEPWVTGEVQDRQSDTLDREKVYAHNSWMILSKLMTANRRDAIAAPEMSESATIRSNEAVFVTVDGETFVGIG